MEQPEAPSLDEQAKAFFDLHADNWHGLVAAGVPLYRQLVAAHHPEAPSVAETLRHLVLVMEHSGAGKEDEKQALREKIEAALQEA